ncbi:MAG: T9SS type A sorting domain-containing protein [Bacteroidia bacterium]
MKKLTALIVLALFAGICYAQTIDLSLTSPSPQLQDADVGAMAFADIDNDGDNDLLISGKGGPIKTTLYRNDGQGNLSEIMGTPFDNLFAGTVGFEDIDNDGDQDVLMTGNTSSPQATAKLYKNDGLGNFTLEVNTPFEPSSGGDFDFGDIDNDGDKDIILTGYNAAGNAFTTLYSNNGSGTFTAVIGAIFEDQKGGSVAFADLDNDSDLDVLLVGQDNSGNPSSKMYANNGTGSFTLVANTAFENCAGGDFTIGDTDNDGDLDVFICGVNGSGAYLSNLYLNNGTGSFSLVSGTPFQPTSVGTTSFADFDGDGDIDLLLAGSGVGGLITNSIIANIYENQGSNSFVLADSLTGAYLSSTAIGDIDGDQDLDLVIGGTSTGFPVRGTRMYTNNAQVALSIENELEGNVESNLTSSLIFPNPTRGTFHINMEKFAPSRIDIIDRTGKLVYSDPHASIDNTQVSLNVPSGMYFIRLSTPHKTLVQKLIVKQ